MESPEIQDRIKLAEIGKDVSYIKDGFNELRTTVARNYVTQTEFKPVKLIAFGLVGLILIEVIGAILFVILGLKRA